MKLICSFFFRIESVVDCGMGECDDKERAEGTDSVRVCGSVWAVGVLIICYGYRAVHLVY